MAQDINISKDLYDLLVSKNFDPSVTDATGQETTPDEGTVFKFDYISSTGKNYGTAVALISDDQEQILFFGDNLGKSMDDPEDKDEWFSFLQQMSKFATRHSFHTFTPKNLNAIKHTMAGMAAIKEGLFEGYYGNRKVSYMGEATDARLVIKHNRLIGEDDKRYRYVESLFIETADGERFKLPFTKLVGGRAMLEHVRQGGRPYDVRGTHIAETVQEMSVLARFNRASQGRIFEGQTQQLVEAAREYYHNLQNNLKHMGTARGYSNYFESWSPADIGEQEALVEDLKTMFIEQTLDNRIEAALPTLAKIQGNTMKEANEFEAWANKLVEGTWALPETPEAKDKLYSLLNSALPVGPDAANATEQLYDIFGDDELFDRLSDLADRDANADARPIVIARMKELGLEVPGVKANPDINEGDNLATFEGDTEDAIAAFLSRGGAVQQGKYHRPRKSEKTDYGSKHIGTIGGAGKPGKMSGTAANVGKVGKPVVTAESGTVAGAIAPLEESRMAEVDAIIQGIISGDLDPYDIMTNPTTPEEQYVAKILEKEYENVSIDHRLHPDDDFETIFDYVIDHLAQDYGHSVEEGYTVSPGFDKQRYQERPGLEGPFHTKSGKVVYYDKQEGKYYDPDTDMYIEYDDWQDMNEDSTDPMDHRGAVTDSFYEDLDRLKKLAFVKRT